MSIRYHIRVWPDNGAWIADVVEGDPADDPLLFGETTQSPDMPGLLAEAGEMIAAETGLQPGDYELTLIYAIPIAMKIGDSPLRTVGWVHRSDDDAEDLQALADLMRRLAREFDHLSAVPDYLGPGCPQPDSTWHAPPRAP